MDLNYRQFDWLAELSNHPDVGGFTAATKGPRAGKAPPSRLMVGTEAEGGVAASPVTGDEIMQYAEENKISLARKNRYLGGWASGGQTHLDVPRGYPDTPAGESQARRATVRENQMAYGRLDERGDYVGDVDNPVHPATNVGDITVPANDPVIADEWTRMALNPRQRSGRKARSGESFS